MSTKPTPTAGVEPEPLTAKEITTLYEKKGVLAGPIEVLVGRLLATIRDRDRTIAQMQPVMGVVEEICAEAPSKPEHYPGELDAAYVFQQKELLRFTIANRLRQAKAEGEKNV